ncbi:g3186 [Coccomyxa elongata]
MCENGKGECKAPFATHGNAVTSLDSRGLPALVDALGQTSEHDRIQLEVDGYHRKDALEAVLSMVNQLALAVFIGLTCNSPVMAATLPPVNLAAQTSRPQYMPSRESEVASQYEDRILETLKKVGAHVDSAVGAFSNLSHLGDRATQSPEAEEAQRQGQELVKEVWAVVSDYYLDARGSGFSQDKWAALRDKYMTQPFPTHEAAYRAIREMLAYGLNDPYTRFITPDEFQTMRKYDVTGVGLNLASAEEFTRKSGLPLPPDRADTQGGVWVLGMIKGAAADRAGVRQGDEVLSVDGHNVAGLSPFKVAGLLQGSGDDAAPSVSLMVKRQDGSSQEVQIERPVRSVPSPVTTYVEDRGGKKVGHINLSAFNARALSDVVAAVRQMEAEGAAELVLDLRDNRGGLVQEGIEIAKLFLDDGMTVVVTETGARRDERAVRAEGPPLTAAPLTVMVNEHTASASEIFAGALHDNCRALLVGTRTYGKGLIQSVYELSDSSGLVLTVGKYLTPARTDIDREGLRPDFRHMPSSTAAAEHLSACRLTASKANGGVESGTLASM